MSKSSYPIIDLFAGPGGLGEGFSSSKRIDGSSFFTDGISIERDTFSHETLLLRHFLKTFENEIYPDEYYAYLEDKITLEMLFAEYPLQADKAKKIALKLSLGPEEHANVKSLISSCLKDQKKWALVGGPPCQAYSLVGRSRMMQDPNFENDERHFLYREYLKIIADHQPPIFVMENVKGLLSAKIDGEPAIKRILKDLEHPTSVFDSSDQDLSYKLHSLSEDMDGISYIKPQHFLIKAEEYGVPQARHRMFIVGVRKDIRTKLGQLKKTPPPTIKDMIDDLPKIRSGLSKAEDSFDNWSNVLSEFNLKLLEKQLEKHENGSKICSLIKKAINDVKLGTKLTRIENNYPRTRKKTHPLLDRLRDNRLKTLTGHETRGHMSSDLHRYLFAAAFAEVCGVSPKLCDFPNFLLPAHQNVKDGQAGKMFSDRFRVQTSNKVATTVTSHISKDGHYFIHYDPRQARSLTVREAARLQTFPDNYKFEGPRTSQFHQIGNAVPPHLARQISVIIGELLDETII